MKIEQNIISRDWTVLHKGRRFYVNFSESDGQTLMLCNRGNWEVSEETDDGVEELDSCKKESGRLVEELVAFCIDNWDNGFMHELQDDLWGLRGHLDGQKALQENGEHKQ